MLRKLRSPASRHHVPLAPFTICDVCVPAVLLHNFQKTLPNRSIFKVSGHCHKWTTVRRETAPNRRPGLTPGEVGESHPSEGLSRPAKTKRSASPDSKQKSDLLRCSSIQAGSCVPETHLWNKCTYPTFWERLNYSFLLPNTNV